MARAPRGMTLLALALTVLCHLPQPGRAGEDIEELDYATVGRVVTRFVDGRTVVVIPVSGTPRPKLSEPIRTGNRWRLDLVLEDAKLATRAPVRRSEGVASLTVREVGTHVRISVVVNRLGDYGARRSEEGMLLWIEAERSEPVASLPDADPATISMSGSSVLPQGVRMRSESPARPERRNWVGLIGLAVGAAAAGAGFRHVRRNGWPDRVTELVAGAGPRLREKLTGAGRKPGTERPRNLGIRVPLGEPADARGRSAEIGDAFRVQPEKPASGIAGLAVTNDNDAE